MILNKGIEWLDSFKTENLFLSAAVIIANYLRSGNCLLFVSDKQFQLVKLFLNLTLDEYVKKLMQDSRQPHVKIIEIIKSFIPIEKLSISQINKIHSFLGCLRNFCVAGELKQICT